MKNLARQALLPLAVAAAAVAPVAAAAVTLPFNASYSGTTQVVEVVNAVGPVLRFETVASGAAAFDLGSYFSTDVIDMSSGVGSGSNRFVAGNGDVLYGSFDVQVIPTAVANVVDLIGIARFAGGTGLFHGASGSAQLAGSGVFTSATSALASLGYNGSIALVPEPGGWLMLPAGLAWLALAARRRPASGQARP